ncbi:MAG: choice-of-anchor J domain-containing protein [Paludibacter sp.]
MNTKKLIYYGLLLLVISFTACKNDIEQPQLPNPKTPNSLVGVFTEKFENDLGQFTQYAVSGKQKWTWSKFQCAMINGNVNGIPYGNEQWLISPLILLNRDTTSLLSFDYAANGFADVANEVTLWGSPNYSSDSLHTTNPDSLFKKATWFRIYPVSSIINTGSWTMTNIADISLKKFVDTAKKVINFPIHIAFRYLSTEKQAGVLQIRNVALTHRTPVQIPYRETFSTKFGKFSTQNVTGSLAWSISYSAATISGSSSNSFANEDWIISPQIDLTKVDTATLSFDHAARYFSDLPNEATIWISKNYDEGLPSTAIWKQLKTTPFKDPGSWTFSTSGDIGLDTTYAGKKVTIAFRYLSPKTEGSWEIKNFYIR